MTVWFELFKKKRHYGPVTEKKWLAPNWSSAVRDGVPVKKAITDDANFP